MASSDDLDKLDSFIEAHIGTRTSRYASEIRHQCPNVKDIARAERIMRTGIEETFHGARVRLVNAAASATIRAQYISKAWPTSEPHGAIADFDLDDYFTIDTDRHYGAVRANTIARFGGDSLCAVFFHAVDNCVRALAVDPAAAARFVLSLLQEHMPLLIHRAQASATERTQVAASRQVLVDFFTSHVSDHLAELDRNTSRAPCEPRHYSAAPFKNSPIQLLTLSRVDVESLERAFRVQDRPYSYETLAKAAEFYRDEALQNAVLCLHMACVDQASEYFSRHPDRLNHSLEPFTEIFVGTSPSSFVPNPKLLRVVGHNILPAIASAVINSGGSLTTPTPHTIRAGVALAHRLNLFQAYIMELQRDVAQSVDRDGVGVRLGSLFVSTCPARRMFISALLAGLPRLYGQLD